MPQHETAEFSFFGKQHQNYVFDLYGTLVDIHTEEDSIPFWQRFSMFLAMEGVPYTPDALREKYKSWIRAAEITARAQLGDGVFPEIDLAPLFLSFYTDAGIPADSYDAARLARVFRTLSLEKLRLFDGVTELLTRLREAGRGVYLLSNAQALFTRPELRLLGLEKYFHGILLSSEVGYQKPDPHFYEALFRRYGLDPAQTIMVGNDDVADCHGAAAAGLDSIYIFTEQSPALSAPLPANCLRLERIAQVFPFE